MAVGASGLQTHIWNNNLKSMLMLAFYPLILIGIVWACAFVIGYISGGTPYPAHQSLPNTGGAGHFANGLIADYWPAILTVVVIWFAVAYFFHGMMVRGLAKSHPVTRKEEPELYNLLENLCIAEGMTMPRLEVIETHARNAFASGISDETYTVTVTRGLMNALAKDELEAVLAHELTHIKNRDVRLLIITIIFTGMIGFAAQLLWMKIRYSFYFGRRGNNRDAGKALLVLMAIAAVLWIGYLATLFMRFAISRRREYMADAGAVAMTKNPDAMMRALLRIAGKDRMPAMSDDIAMMCVENHKRFMGLFATHPPIPQRVQALSEMTGAPAPDAQSLPPVKKQERYVPQRSHPENPWLTARRHNKS